MKSKYWNKIYFFAMILPVAVYLLSFVTFDVGGTTYTFMMSDVFDEIVSLANDNISLMPVCYISKFIQELTVLPANLLTAWTVGVDFVLWLAIMHIVVDLFMLMVNLFSSIFKCFGGAD